jgi:hypothetical protein
MACPALPSRHRNGPLPYQVENPHGQHPHQDDGQMVACWLTYPFRCLENIEKPVDYNSVISRLPGNGYASRTKRP